MLEKLEIIFQEKKVLSIDDLKEILYIEDSKEFVELIKKYRKVN